MISTRETSQNTRNESKTRAVVRINMCLSSGDYAGALDLLRESAVEFPNDAELAALEKLAQDGALRKGEADRLITESQELFAQRKSAEAIQLLRKAYELDKQNALSRTILANALVEHAYSIVETDWWEAETMANEALALNPTHPTAKTINNLIVDRKTKGSVEEWVAQTRKLQASGNLSAALAQIAEGFAVYPHEPRLLQIQDAIQRDHSTERRQARRRDLEDLRRTASEVDAAADVAAKKTLAERIKAVTAKYSTDGEILSIANALLLRLGQTGVRQKSSTESPDSEGATRIEQPSNLSPSPSPPSPSPLPIAPEVLRAATSQVPANWIPTENSRKTKVPAKKVPANIAPSSIVPPSIVLPSEAQPSIVPTGIVPTDIVPAGKALTSPPEQLPAPLPRPKTSPVLTVEPSVPAAKVTAPSITSSSPRTEQPARSNSTRMILVAAAAIIVVAAISYFAGTHHTSPEAKTPAAAPSLSAPADSAPTAATPAVSAPAPEASKQTTPEPSTPASALPAPTPSSSTAAGKVTADNHAHAVPAPTPSTVIEPGHNESGHNVPSQNLGTLLIVAGQDNARVLLNGKLQSQLTQAGQLRLPNLELKDYVVQISKSGFQDPPQQKIRIRKGEPARLVFTLKPNLQPNLQPNLKPNAQPLPRLASLTIQGAAPGATVLVDQTVVGTIQPDGTLSVSSVNPGDHIVELRKAQFKPRQFKEHFVAGGNMFLAVADAAMEAAPGELKINFSPADATVAIAKTGVLPTMVSSGVPLTLAAGTYTLTARTAERFTRSSTIEIIGGQSKTLDLSLAPNGMSKWEDPGAWKHEKDSFIRKGGDFVLYGAAPAAGTFTFSAMPTKGHVLQWVLNYTDTKNYILIQMDEDNFYRAVIRNGNKTDEIKVADKGDKKSFRMLQIKVSPTEIVHQIRHGDRWTVLDRWTPPGANPSLGKFGFYIPGNDEVAVSAFAHYADLNIR